MNLLPKGIFDKLVIITDLKPSKAKLEAFSGANLGNIGSIMLNCKPVKGSPHTAQFFVTMDGKTPIIRLKHSLIFEPIPFRTGVYTDTS